MIARKNREPAWNDREFAWNDREFSGNNREFAWNNRELHGTIEDMHGTKFKLDFTNTRIGMEQWWMRRSPRYQENSGTQWSEIQMVRAWLHMRISFLCIYKSEMSHNHLNKRKEEEMQLHGAAISLWLPHWLLRNSLRWSMIGMIPNTIPCSEGKFRSCSGSEVTGGHITSV